MRWKVYESSFVGLENATTLMYVAFLPYGSSLIFLKCMIFVPETVLSAHPCTRHDISLLFTSIHKLEFMPFIWYLYSCIFPNLGLSTVSRDTVTALTLPW